MLTLTCRAGRLNSVSVELSEEEAASWALERNTWQLFSALYRYARTQLLDLIVVLGLTLSVDVQGAPRAAAAVVPFAGGINLQERLQPTTNSLQQSTRQQPATIGAQRKPSPPISAHSSQAQADLGPTFPQAIRDWLHSISTQHNPAEVRRGYLNQTKHKLKQARRTGANPPRGLVTELDPDGVLRAAKDGPGSRLDVDDAVSRTSDYSHYYRVSLTVSCSVRFAPSLSLTVTVVRAGPPADPVRVRPRGRARPRNRHVPPVGPIMARRVLVRGEAVVGPTAGAGG